MSNEAQPSSNQCNCPNGTYLIKHTAGCYERQIERLQREVSELQACLYDEQHGITANTRTAHEPSPGAENDPLVVWVLERLENCQEIATKKTGDDRAGWLDDAQQFAAILRRLSTTVPPVVDAAEKLLMFIYNDQHTSLSQEAFRRCFDYYQSTSVTKGEAP